ncbi:MULTISPECIES: DUF2000 family protein [Brevibacterium]|nr:DUF2000 family protein [Brevibacterium casei]
MRLSSESFRARRASRPRAAPADLNLVGVALHGPKNAVDRTVKGARMHP